jgi:hypothetical protein
MSAAVGVTMNDRGASHDHQGLWKARVCIHGPSLRAAAWCLT